MGIVAGNSYLMGAGQTGTIAYPAQGTNPGKWTTCRLQNASPFPVQLRLGGLYLDTLPAWTANVYPLLSAGDAQGIVSGSPPPLTYVCVTPANAPPSGSGDTTLYTDFGLFGDQFPGSYPQPLAGQAIAAAVTGAVQLANLSIGSFTVPDTAAAVVSKSFAIPANTHAIKIFAVQTSGATNATAQLGVTGDQSGEIYLSSVQLNFDVGGPPNQAAVAPIVLPWSGSSMDTSATFGWTNPNTGFGGWTVYIIGSSDPANVIATIAPQPVQVTPSRHPDHAASNFQGGNTTHQLVAGAFGQSLRIFNVWCGITASGAAPGGSFGCYVQRANDGLLLARVQMPNALVAVTMSNPFPDGLELTLNAGDAINLVTDNAAIFGWGGIAYAIQ